LVRDPNAATETKDVETILSFCLEDATLEVPEGSFEGKAEIGRYWKWQLDQGEKLCAVHLIEGNMPDGSKWATPVACIYNFTNGRIQSHRICFDRLSLARQAARGWLASRLINSIVSKMEKGLH